MAVLEKLETNRAEHTESVDESAMITPSGRQRSLLEQCICQQSALSDLGAAAFVDLVGEALILFGGVQCAAD
jgi:hypothetical protein